MSVRLHNLAKEIGIENRELMMILKDKGYDVRSPSATIDSITAESISREFADISASKRVDVVSRFREQQSRVSADDRLVFVIAAFKEDLEAPYEGIKAAAHSVGLNAKRIKDVEGDYRITDKIIEMIKRSRFVVADLSHERPNVYFELGYARGIKKSVVTILKKGTHVHFDVKDWSYLVYEDSRDLEAALKKRFYLELHLPNNESDMGGG